MKKPSGFALIILATAAAGVAAYVVTWIVPRLIGGVDYKVFAVFWAAMYLVVTALSGLQQEVTRATRPVNFLNPRLTSMARNFGYIASGSAFIMVLSTAPLWVDQVFPELGWALVYPLAVGVASYVLVATLSGVLYGISEWKPLAWLIVSEAVLRLSVVGVLALLSHDLVVLAWAAALPFGATLVVLWPFIRRSVVRRSELDVGYRRLLWNVARTLLASASAGLLVSGLPLILSLTSEGEPPQLLASLFLTITLTRAPLIVTLMSIQGYLIVRFRDHATAMRADMLKYMSIIAGGAAILAAGGWALGPAIFGWLFPGEPVLEGWFFALLVGSSAVVGSLSVTAPALLARGQHAAYSLGWVLAAVVTVAALALPLDLLVRTSLALLIGPLAGVMSNGVVLLRKQPGASSA